MEPALQILLVEDNISNQKVMNAYLDYLGQVTTVACNASEALELARAARFDLVLSDNQLPDMSGIDLIAVLREMADPVPYLVAVTAMARSDGEAHYRELGFDGYLAKPVWREDLQHLLGKVMSG